VSARFIKPMESLAVKKLPMGDKWTYEVKLDGFRAIAVQTDHVASIRSKEGS
jgi:ATP-dependent DNA ligase